MNIALDISPLKSGHFLQHRVRGTGFYTKHLMDSLQRFFPVNQYTFFAKGEKIPQDTDIIHIPYFEPFFFTIPIRKIGKTVVTVHDLTPLVFPDYFPSGLKGKLRWLIQKYALRKLDAIITDSESSKKDIINLVGIDEKKVHVVYLAAGEQFQRISKLPSGRQNLRFQISNLQKKYNLPEKFALYVGDITWNKNLPRLVTAIKQTNIPLVMVGKALTEKNFDSTNPWNQDRMTVQKLIEEDNRSNKKQIYCLGYVPSEELVLLYNAASIFLMPSLYEGFGLPILEAMSSGCPVITTSKGSLKEVAGDAAYFVDAFDTENIANGIKEVFSNMKLQKELIERGYQQAEKFSWEKTVNDTIAVYVSLVNK